MRVRPFRIGLRGVIVAVALFALVFAAALEISGARMQRVLSLGRAREYRWYESRIREDIAKYDACAAARHVGDPTIGMCRTCGSYLLLNDYDGHPLRTPGESAEALRGVAELFARIAARHERDALRPWAWPSPLPAADRASMIALHGGQGPIHPRFFDVY